MNPVELFSILFSRCETQIKKQIGIVWFIDGYKRFFTIIRQLNFNEPKLNEIANIQPKSIDLQLQYNQKDLLESNLQF